MVADLESNVPDAVVAINKATEHSQKPDDVWEKPPRRQFEMCMVFGVVLGS